MLPLPVPPALHACNILPQQQVTCGAIKIALNACLQESKAAAERAVAAEVARCNKLARVNRQTQDQVITLKLQVCNALSCPAIEDNMS